jgi:hypothetical protein
MLQIVKLLMLQFREPSVTLVVLQGVNSLRIRLLSNTLSMCFAVM